MLVATKEAAAKAPERLSGLIELPVSPDVVRVIVARERLASVLR
jgi:hypothetical protein